MSRNINFNTCVVTFLSLSISSFQKDQVPFQGIQTDSANSSEKVDTAILIETTYPTSSSEEILSYSDEPHEATTVVAAPQNKSAEKQYVVKEICANFIYAGTINLNSMVDLWQTSYYRATEKVPCFKMFIRKLTMKEKQLYKQKYGNFDDSVEWEDCNLELRSSMEIKKHFLQGCEKGHGVLENIIIGDKNDTTSKYNLDPESPDQWLVVQNLLLMRDCDTGDVIVFSRVPHKPHSDVIIEALKQFGENTTDGKFICGDQPPIKKKAIEVEEETEESI